MNKFAGYTLIALLSIGNAMANTFDDRRNDWRIGAMTYHIFLDRFAPSANLDAKKHLYAAPRSLRPWSENPKKEGPSDQSVFWTHELSFWGGDLNSLSSKLDYIDDLGMDVVYLNPIVKAMSNHKYDAIDFYQIAPEYGTFDDLKALTTELHKKDMRLVLDGVFNHVGYYSDWFQDALKNKNSKYRDWFYFDDTKQNGYVGWWGVKTLPEFNWHNPEVIETIATNPDSVVKHYFKYGIDGWRLDVATELGFEHLRTITTAAHEAKSDSLVIGEVWSYPKDWTEALDAVMNYPLRQLMFNFVEGKLDGRLLGEQIATMVADSGIEPILRSWIVLDNHDTQRLKTEYPTPTDNKLLQILQMTLPGAPLIYYGVELGMVGGHDPGSRGPMRWDLLNDENPDLTWFKKLISIRNERPALKVGNYLPLASSMSLAFMRVTDKVSETTIVVVNNSDKTVEETLLIRDPRIMSGDTFTDLLSGDKYPSQSAVLPITIAPKSALILAPEMWPEHVERTGHSAYKHID